MGQPKFSRSKTQTPSHPWKAARIEEEHALKRRYGLKKVGGMREIWREKSALRRHRQQAMKLIGKVDASVGHFAREHSDMLSSLNRKGLLGTHASLDDVLQITVEHMLDRRLQSQVYYRGYAPSMRSARSMIVHGHISIGEQRMTVPGYHVLREEEETIGFHHLSTYNDPNHAVRIEMDKRREMQGGEGPEDAIGVVREESSKQAFVEQIKADEATLPSAEDTIPAATSDGGEA
jgi:small subunit ribosomal protein S4